MIRHAVLPVPIPAVIHVIAAAMIPVRPERQKTIPVPMLLRPSAVRAATGVKTVRPARPIGTVLMSDLLNAVAAILVPIPVLPVPVAEPAVLPAMTRFMSVRPNAAQAVTAVRSIITLIPVRAVIRLQTALVLTGIQKHTRDAPAVRQTAQDVTNAIRTRIVILVLPDTQLLVLTDIPIHPLKPALAAQAPELAINVVHKFNDALPLRKTMPVG